MLKKCIALLLVLFFITACTSKEEQQQSEQNKLQGEENALTYIKEKYDIEPAVKEVHVGYIDTSPIPNLNRKTDGTVRVDMVYHGTAFTVNIIANEKSSEGSDNFQHKELQEAYKKRLEQQLGISLHISEMDFTYVYEDGHGTVNMFPKNQKYKNGDILQFLKNVKIKAQVYTLQAPSLKALTNISEKQKTAEVIVLNFKTEYGMNRYLDTEQISYSNDAKFIYHDIQEQFAFDLQDSLYFKEGREYHTAYTPRFSGDTQYYTFNENGEDTSDPVELYIDKANPDYFQDMEAYYDIFSFSNALTIKSSAHHAVLYLPEENFIKERKPTKKNSSIELWRSSINHKGIRTSEKVYDTSLTKIADYTDKNGTAYKRIVPYEKSITFCYVEAQAKKYNK